MSKCSKLTQDRDLPGACSNLARLTRTLTGVVCALWFGLGGLGPNGQSLATPSVLDLPSWLGNRTIVDNGIARFVVDKNIGGLSSLQLNGLEMLGNGGSITIDANLADLGAGGAEPTWRLGTTNGASYSFTTGLDFVDVAVSHSATSIMPFDVTAHYVMRDGESGFHLYYDFEHTAAMADKSIVQTRFVVRGDPDLFDHHSVTDTRFAIMPTSAELAAGTALQDATVQLDPGSAYEAETGKDVYTKYDWSLDNESKEVIGFYGDGVGAWVMQPNLETQAGGPSKQPPISD